MQMILQQVGPDLVIGQASIGPIVSVMLDANSAPTSLADAADGGTPASTDFFLGRRMGALVAFAQGAVVAGLAASAAAAAIAAVSGSLSTIGSSLTTLGMGVATLDTGLAAADAAIANIGTTTVINVLSHGADPTGVADSASAVQAALQALPNPGGTIYFPPGDYKMASAVMMSGKPVMIAGAGRGFTRLHFTHTGIGFDISPGSVLSAVIFRDFTAWAEATSGPSAAVARVTYPVQSSGYETVAIEAVDVRGYPNSQNGTAPFPQTWQRGFILLNAWKPRLTNCAWFGPPSAAGATGSAFLEIAGCNDTQLLGIQAQYGNSLIVQSGYCEGVRLRASVAINTDHVLIQTAQAGWPGYSPGWVSLLDWRFVDCELNVALGHVVLTGATIGFVTSCDITRNSGPSTAQTLFMLTDCSQIIMAGCNLNGGPGGIDIAWSFSAVNNSSANVLTASRFNNMATAIAINGANGTVGLMASDLDLGNLPAATAILDGSGITAGDRIWERGHASASNPSGIKSARDFVFQGADDSVVIRFKSVQGVIDYLEAVAASTGGAATCSLGPFLGAAGFTLTSPFNLYLSPTNQLWLGDALGDGAVYSATIGATTGNPGAGALFKVWNNGGALSMARSDGLNPLPLFQPAFLATQSFGDIPGSSGIFPHFPPPAPPSSRAGLLQGDRWKAQGVFSAADFVAPSANVDSYPGLQAWLLYVQAMFLAQSGTAYLNQFNRGYFTAHLPAGFYLISQPLVVPRWVRLGGPGVLIPAPYVGPQSGATVSGIFDGTVNAQTNWMPLVVCACQAHLGDLNLYPAGAAGGYQYRTSGVVIGKNWTAQGVQSIGSAGTGYAVGQVYLLANPDPAPYSATFVTVTAVNGTGGVTAATVLYAGAYSLPPASGVYNGAPGLQETAWSAAAGYDGAHQPAVFDPAVPHALLVVSQASGLGTGGTAGTGASIIPSWQPDFTTGGQQYATGVVSVPNDTIAGQIAIHSAVQNNFSSAYGPTFNIQVSGLECEIGSIRGLGGRAGLWAINCQDLRIGKLNVVDAATFFWARYSGSIECANCVPDTCGQVSVIDQSHGVILDGVGRAFFEEGNIKNPLPACNTGYVGSTSPGAISIGFGSSATAPVIGCRLRFKMHNMGGLPASTIAAKALTGVSPSTQLAACCITNAIACEIDIQVSNYSQYPAPGGGAAPSLLPVSALFAIEGNVDPGCVLRGSIDTLLVIDGVPVVAAVVFCTSGAQPACRIDVRDTFHNAHIEDGGLAKIIGTGLPVNGTTGAGFAWPGSTYLNMATGISYRNTGSLVSPSWTTP